MPRLLASKRRCIRLRRTVVPPVRLEGLHGDEILVKEALASTPGWDTSTSLVTERSVRAKVCSWSKPCASTAGTCAKMGAVASQLALAEIDSALE